MHEDGADRNPALGQASLRLLDRRSEKLVHGCAPVPGLLVRDQITLSSGPCRPAVAAGIAKVVEARRRANARVRAIRYLARYGARWSSKGGDTRIVVQCIC
jgi:hypothetical protein